MSISFPVVRRIAGLSIVLLALAGCDQLGIDISQFTGGSTSTASNGATEALKSGDLAGAEAALDAVPLDQLTVDDAINLAFVQLSKGKYAEADTTLAAVEAKASPEQLPGVHLRRAMVALRAGRPSDVKDHGLASGTPEGKLLAAEFFITNFEGDRARELLQSVQQTPGAVGQAAGEYLKLLNGGPDYEVLAELTALWALGDRSQACTQAAEALPTVEEGPRKLELQLLWAGRAVTSGQPQVASELLASMDGVPPNQAWRRQAVQAMVMVTEGQVDEAVQVFDLLSSSDVPADGLADARATAAALTKDPASAKRLVGDLESSAVSKGLLEAGDRDGAKLAAPEGSALKKLME